MNKSWMILFVLLLVSDGASSQEGKVDSLLFTVSAIDTIVVKQGLPLYIVRWLTRERSSSNGSTSSNIDDRIEIRREGDTTLLQFFSLKEGVTNLSSIDISFDGYSDLKVDVDPWEQSHRSFFYIFNPDDQLFEFSDEFSQFTAVNVNLTDSLLVTSTYLGEHGTEGEFYKVLGHHPVLVRREIDRDDTSSIALLINGAMVTTQQTAYIQKQDSKGRWYREVTHETIIDGNLRLTKKEILRPPVGNEPTSGQRNNGLYRDDFRGEYILQSEAEYKYGKNKRGRKYRDVFEKRVIKDRLKLVKQGREYLN